MTMANVAWTLLTPRSRELDVLDKAGTIDELFDCVLYFARQQKSSGVAKFNYELEQNHFRFVTSPRCGVWHGGGGKNFSESLRASDGNIALGLSEMDLIVKAISRVITGRKFFCTYTFKRKEMPSWLFISGGVLPLIPI